MKKLLCIIICITTVLFTGCEYNLNNSSTNYTEYVNSENVTVFCLDVGQGDSTLITFKNTVILIDAGNPENADYIVEFLESLNIKTINYLIATHPHSDHIGGMATVIDSLDIENIYLPKIADSDIPTTKVYENFLDAVANENCNVFAAKGGTTITNSKNFKFEIIAPNGTNYGNLNNYSVVTKLTYYKSSMLFMGDAEKTVENEIIAKHYNIKADIIKIGHHGSYTSSSKKFLKKSNIKNSVISCGIFNKYNHPNDKTLNTLNSLNCNIYRTDTDGTIIISLNRNGYKINTDNSLNFYGGK